MYAGMRMLNSQVKALALPKPRSYKTTDHDAVFKCSIILLILGSDLLDENMQVIQLFQLFSLFFLANASPLPVSIRDATSDANTPQCPSFCAGTLTNESLIHDYVCGDTRLGPKRLPTHLPLGSLLDIYDQFGGLCPGQFLAKWFNSTSGYYNYPPVDGFQLNTASAPIEGTITFPVGFLMDRFGSEYGSFVSPAGAPYMQRALPPSNLDTPPADPR
jgi:hypothetical protein